MLGNEKLMELYWRGENAEDMMAELVSRGFQFDGEKGTWLKDGDVYRAPSETV